MRGVGVRRVDVGDARPDRPQPDRARPDLAARVGRETADFKKDVRKLKELGLTESLAIGYLLSPRGEAVVDAGLPVPRERAPRETGTPLPRNIGAPATRALREVGVTTLEQVAATAPPTWRPCTASVPWRSVGCARRWPSRGVASPVTRPGRPRLSAR